MKMLKRYYRRYRQKQFWKKIVSVMGCFVVFCTTYALILPAITMDEGTICGLHEHQHTSDCYLMGESYHTHTDDCYVETLTYVCGQEEQDGFFDELFYTPEENTSGSAFLYDVDEPARHVHDESCEEITMELICGLEESEPHMHIDICYDENGELICELPTESDEPLLICDITPHIHSDGCFPSEQDSEKEDSDESLKNTDATEPEQICGKESHFHEENCYDIDGNLVCMVEEHMHETSCYDKAEDQNIEDENAEDEDIKEPACGKTAHPHEDVCYDAEGNLLCPLEEHQHDDSCYPEELVYQIIYATVYTDETCAEPMDTMESDTWIEITGRLPVGIFAKAYPVFVELTDKEVVCAYDITLYHEDDTIYEPTGEENITVAIMSPELYSEHPDAEQPVDVYYVPEEGEPEWIASTRTDEGISFDTTHFSVYMVTRNGSANYTVNTVKDAFLKDSAYEIYYNSNSPIGTAGSFHLVAFGDARLNTHTNGNILAKNLYAGSNFGTNGYANELTYVQNYMQVNGVSASSTEHILVLGSSNTVTSTDNGNAFNVRGPSMNYDQKLDKPKYVIQDEDTDTAPFIDLERVEDEVRQIALKLSAMENANITYPKESDQYSVMQLTKPSGVGVVNLTVAELDALGGHGNTIRMSGFTDGANGTIVINVDCTGVSEIWMPSAPIYVDGNMVSMNETVDFSAGKVIWNFVNAEGVTINTYLMTGMIVAPGANVNIKQNLNGTVVAENIKVEAESHRTDFTGTIIEPEPEKQPYQITIMKHETGYVTKTLAGAEFRLYEWDSNQGSWILINAEGNPENVILITDANGVISLSGLDRSKAYRLVETKEPFGYERMEEPYYFWIRASKNDYAPSEPYGFSGKMVDAGNTLYMANNPSDQEAVYVLPDTGGSGNLPLMTAGMMLILLAAFLLIKQYKRKEAKASF